MIRSQAGRKAGRFAFWKKHASPWSVYTRMSIYPFLYLSLWYHNWYALGAVILFTAVNPVLFAQPKSIDNWASKGVLGEQLWVRRLKLDFSMVLSVTNGAFFIPSVYFAWTEALWPLLYTATVSFLAKVWFVDRMGFYYVTHRTVPPDGGGAPGAHV